MGNFLGVRTNRERAYFQYSWSPLERNEGEHYLGSERGYHGPIPRRDDDVVGVGVAHARFRDRLHWIAGLTYETVEVFFYRVQVAPFASLQPLLPYIDNPGGNGREASDVGLRFEVNF